MKVVYLTGARPGILTISLMQWVFGRICDKQEFNISPKDVIFVNPASYSMEDYYWGTVDYFNKMKEQLESQVDLDKNAHDNLEDSVVDDDSNQNDTINMLMEMLKGSTKRTLH